MFRLIALWPVVSADEAEAYEVAYLSDHCAAARKLPKLSNLEIVVGQGASQEVETPIAYAAIMTWADRETFEQDTATSEWKNMRMHTAHLKERFAVSPKYVFGDCKIL
jgi:hypothetical protein